MEQQRLQIGELLIEGGVLNHANLREALQIQRTRHKPLGQILVEAGFVTEAQLIQALSRQLSIPWVSLWHVDVPPELLSLVAREDAEKYRILPIYVRSVRGEPPALFVAIDDPTNEEALVFLREASGMVVRPMIAGPTDLQSAIRALYSGEEEDEEEEAARERTPSPPVGRRASAPPPPPLPPPRRSVPPTESAASMDAIVLDEPVDDEPAAEPAAVPAAVPEGVSAPPAEAAAASSGGEAVAESGSAPAAPEAPSAAPVPAGTEAAAALAEGLAAVEGTARVRKRQRRAIAFTFLDGTSITLGNEAATSSAADASPAETPDEVTVPKLAAQLRRFADDPASREPLGERGVARILGALLDALHRKSLLSDDELRRALQEPPR